MPRNNEYNPELWNAIQQNKPFKTYRKTILAKVFVTVYDPFKDTPTGILLEGIPGEDPKSFINVYDEMEDVFFKRMNRRHLDVGTVILSSALETKEAPETIEQAEDDKLREVVNSKFFTLKNILEKTTSEAFVYRLLTIAQEEEKSVKYIQSIEDRLAEIQGRKVEVTED